MAFTISDKPWEDLRVILNSGNIENLTKFLESLTPSDTALSISRLAPAEQSRLLSMLDPSFAADVIEDVPDSQAAEIIEEMPPEQAAAIVDEMQSDRQADLLSELETEDMEAILKKMTPSDAEEARTLLSYPADSAGGIMISEFLAYRDDLFITDVLEDLQEKREIYMDYHVQYLYIVDREGKLSGVLKMRDLLFTPKSTSLDRVMIEKPLYVKTDDSLEDLRAFFKEHKLFGAPVIDHDNRLVGVVLPSAVEEATQKQTVSQFLSFSGIIGGEEFRSMPLINRTGRRLSWLSINIVLNIIAASVIALYQDTLVAVITLAIFLPMISDMCGCSGNQAVAVSMRELTLGLVKPREIIRVLGKEISLGVVNGAALGLLLGGVALLWKGNPYLGLVVGGALMANTIVSVSLGGVLPLLLKSIKLDPAMVASPILTTITDMCGFFFVLSFATLIISKLG